VFHRVPGEEENTVLRGGATMNNSIIAASTIKTISILLGFLQPLILLIFFLLPAPKAQDQCK
jgi:hypothetical protein